MRLILFQGASEGYCFDTILTSDNLVKEDAEPSETDSDYFHFLHSGGHEDCQESIDPGNIKLEPEEKLTEAAIEKERQKKDNHNKSELLEQEEEHLFPMFQILHQIDYFWCQRKIVIFTFS